MKKDVNDNNDTWIEYDKIISTKTVEVKSGEDFAKFGKSGIAKDALTTDGNGDGNSTFR